jgi:hypothetical protein
MRRGTAPHRVLWYPCLSGAPSTPGRQDRGPPRRWVGALCRLRAQKHRRGRRALCYDGAHLRPACSGTVAPEALRLATQP